MLAAADGEAVGLNVAATEVAGLGSAPAGEVSAPGTADETIGEAPGTAGADAPGIAGDIVVVAGGGGKGAPGCAGTAVAVARGGGGGGGWGCAKAALRETTAMAAVSNVFISGEMFERALRLSGLANEVIPDQIGRSPAKLFIFGDLWRI